MQEVFQNTSSTSKVGINYYDFIICGAGCAGLSLAVHMIHSGKFTGRKILLVDKEEKKLNDRTWCFWETKPGIFEEIVYRRWNKVWFHGQNFSRLLPLAPYEYKMIRSSDFYNHCLQLLRWQKNFEILYGNVEELGNDDAGAFVVVDGKKISGGFIFNSIIFKKPHLKKNEYWLLQHFKGWVIETGKDIFDSAHANLMDFRVGQERGTTFVYVMPFSAKQALVEYTLFSSSALSTNEYEEGLKNYIRDFLQTDDYRVLDEEAGIIPMTNYRFPSYSGNIVYLGTAGGKTKPSSGYTFQFIQKHSEAIVRQLIRKGNPFNRGSKKRFHFYDSVFLNILHQKKLPGAEIFTSLFQKNKTPDVLRFLDNESSFLQELKIISSLPTLPFLKAAIQQL